MRQSGEYRIDASRETVWDALNDVDVLQRAIPGCQSMEKLADDAYEAKVRARVGPVGADFTADIRLKDLRPPEACTLETQIKGGPAGFGKGSARVTLSVDGEATILRYEAEGSVGGKIAQVGQRLVDGAARKLADDFFAKFRSEIEGQAELVHAASAKVGPGPQGRPTAWRSWFVWVVPLLALAAIAAILAARY